MVKKFIQYKRCKTEKFLYLITSFLIPSDIKADFYIMYLYAL